MNYQYTPQLSIPYFIRPLQSETPKSIRRKLKSKTTLNKCLSIDLEEKSDSTTPIPPAKQVDPQTGRTSITSPRSSVNYFRVSKHVQILTKKLERESSGSSNSTRTSHNSDSSPHISYNRTPKPSTFRKKIELNLPPIEQNTKILKLTYNDDEPLKLNRAKSVVLEFLTPHDFKKLFKLKLKFPQGAIKSSSDEPQSLPLLAKIEVAKPENYKKSPLDLVCVIDKSSNMSGEKLKQVKQALETLVSHMDELDRFSIVTFSAGAVKETPLLCMTSKNKKITMEVINNIQVDGQANIGAGVEYALKIIKNRRMANPVTGVFLLSDGVDDFGLSKVCSAIQEQEIKDQFTINTFGFGTTHDPRHLSEIANLKGGNYYFVENPSLLDQALLNCLGELSSTIALDGELTITPQLPSFVNGKIEIEKYYGNQSSWTKKNESCSVKIGSLAIQKTLNFVVKAKINPYKLNSDNEEDRIVDIFRANFKFKDLEGISYEINRELCVELLTADEEFLNVKVDRDVMLQYWRVRVGETLTQALEFAEKFYKGTANELLQELKSELETSSYKNEPLVKGLIKDLMNAVKDLDVENFGAYGRHNLYAVSRAHEREMFSFQSTLNYSCQMQNSYQAQANSCPVKRIKNLY